MSARDDLASFRVLEQHEALAACLKEEFEDGWADGRKVLVLVADYCSATELASLRGSSDDWYCKKRAGAPGIATPLPGGGAAMIDVVDLRGQAHTAPLAAQFFATGIRDAGRLREAHFGGLPGVVSIRLVGGLHLRAGAFLYSVLLGNPTLLKYDAARAQFSAEGRGKGPRSSHFSAPKRAIADKAGRSKGGLEAQGAAAVSCLAAAPACLPPEIAPEGPALPLNAPDLRAIHQLRSKAEGIFAEGAPRSIRVKPVVQAASVGKPKKPDVRVDALVGRAANKFRKRRNRNFQRPRKPMPAGRLWGNSAYSLHGRVFAAFSFPIEALNPLLGAPPGIRDYCPPEAGKRCELALRNASRSVFFAGAL